LLSSSNTRLPPSDFLRFIGAPGQQINDDLLPSPCDREANGDDRYDNGDEENDDDEADDEIETGDDGAIIDDGDT